MARSNSNDCNCCVYHRGTCTIGITTKSRKRCSNYLPLCVSCPYPDSFCPTCTLRPFNDLKNAEYQDRELGNHMYGCVWDDSSPHRDKLIKIPDK